jgi:RNA polymerase sigma-70 factor (ECF subfamily)
MMPDTHKSRWPLPFSKKRRRAQFERSIEAHLPAMTRLARGIIHNPSDAEDLVHDSCVKALTSGGSNKFENKAKLCAWLNRILVNTYRDHYRRSQRSPLAPQDYHATSDGSMNVYELVASTEQSPLQCMQNRDSSSAIEDALSALPPEVRVVTVLFIVSELSYKEIAYITDCPLGTVMSRLSRGRRLLRETLADFDPREDSAKATAMTGSDKP